MEESQEKEAKMIILPNTGASPRAMMIILADTSSTPVAMLCARALPTSAYCTRRQISDKTICLVIHHRLNGFETRVVSCCHHEVCVNQKQTYECAKINSIIPQNVLILVQNETDHCLYGVVEELTGESHRVCFPHGFLSSLLFSIHHLLSNNIIYIFFNNCYIFIMLGTALGRSVIRKSVYEDFQEKDLRGALEERDRKIRKLEYKVQKLEKEKEQFFKSDSKNESDIARMNFIKEKIRQEIEKNDHAVQIFIESSDRIGKVTQLLQTDSQLSDESSDMKRLVEIIGDANLTSSYPFSEWSEDMENIQSIELELKKRLDELDMTANQFRKCFQELQKHFLNLEKKYKDKIKQLKEYHDHCQDQFKEERQKRERMKKLLQKAEKQKNDVLNEIAFISKVEKGRDLEMMDRNDLVTLTKKLFYRIKDLEKQKTQFLQVANKNKEVQLEKYKKMLIEVKEVKEKSRLGMSIG